MTTPRDNPSELSGRQSAELIRDLLDTKHSQSYMLFALDPYTRGQTSYRKELFHNRVRFPSSPRPRRCVFFRRLISGDRSAIVWRETFAASHRSAVSLSKDQFVPSGVIVKYGCSPLCCQWTRHPFFSRSHRHGVIRSLQDGRNQIAFAACSLIAYHGIFQQVDHIVRFYESRRCAHPLVTSSQKRSVRSSLFTWDISTDSRSQIHSISVWFVHGYHRQTSFHGIDLENNPPITCSLVQSRKVGFLSHVSHFNTSLSLQEWLPTLRRYFQSGSEEDLLDVSGSK